MYLFCPLPLFIHNYNEAEVLLMVFMVKKESGCWFRCRLCFAALLILLVEKHLRISACLITFCFCVLAPLGSRVHVGDNELWAAAVLLAGEPRRDQPAGAGNQAAEARQLPPCPLLTDDALLVLRSQWEAQLHRARGEDQVRCFFLKSSHWTIYYSRLNLHGWPLCINF